MIDPATLDAITPVVLSNVGIAAGLALIACCVQLRSRQSSIAYVLWVAVLLKLVTPPLVELPWLPNQAGPTGISALAPESDSTPTPGVESTAGRSGTRDRDTQPNRRSLTEDANGGGATTESATQRFPSRAEAIWPGAAAAIPPAASTASTPPEAGFATWHWAELLYGIWALGSLLALGWSLTRVLRFGRLLHTAASPAPETVQKIARKTAKLLGLRRHPEILVVPARLSPFVWWTGGRVRIVLPQGLAEQIAPAHLRDVLAHELAHVRRGDHLVRWLEWLTGVAFWWNPLFWLARRQLRLHEEIGCDALVLHSVETEPRRYGESLLSVVEFLSTPAIRPPAVASAMLTGGQLERRLKMIVSRRATLAPRWLQATILTATASLLPLQVATAQDFNAVEKRLGKAVAAGEINLDQARVMMLALRRHAAGELDSAPGRSEPGSDSAKGWTYNRWADAYNLGTTTRFRDGEVIDPALWPKTEPTIEAVESLRALPMITEKAGSLQEIQRDLETRRKKLKVDLESLELLLKKGQITKREAERKGAIIKKKLIETLEKLEGVRWRSAPQPKNPPKAADRPAMVRFGVKAPPAPPKSAAGLPLWLNDANRQRIDQLQKQLAEAHKRGDLTEAESLQVLRTFLERLVRDQGATREAIAESPFAVETIVEEPEEIVEEAEVEEVVEAATVFERFPRVTPELSDEMKKLKETAEQLLKTKNAMEAQRKDLRAATESLTAKAADLSSQAGALEARRSALSPRHPALPKTEAQLNQLLAAKGALQVERRQVEATSAEIEARLQDVEVALKKLDEKLDKLDPRRPRAPRTVRGLRTGR